MRPHRVFLPLFLAVSASLSFAAPTLRLASATVGPITVATGSSGPAQTVEAWNAGDGSLSLSTSSSAPWASASIGAARGCTRRTGSCLPVQIALNTASLAAGVQTAVITVADPNAVDAPQTITVTVQVGGGVPNRIELFAPPESTAETTFYTNSSLTARPSTSTGGNWMSVQLALDGAGSFQFVYPYRVRVNTANLGPGNYDGTIATSGSSFAGDNKSIAVAVRVTTQPILKVVEDVRPVSSVSATGIRVRLAAGTPAYALRTLALSNAGQGTLTVNSATVSGGDWLTVVTAAPATVVPVLDASKLSPGVYNGSLSIVTNAANPNLTLPVQLTVVPSGAPSIRYQGVVDNAVFEPGAGVTPGSILVVIGEQLTAAADTLGKAPPLATEVGGARVLVNGQPAPMYYATYGQLAFQLPYETSLGASVVTVLRDGQTSNRVSVEVVERAPRLLRIGVGDYGAIVNATDGSLPLATSGRLGDFATHPARPGNVLTLYAIGLGPTSPSVASGAAAPVSPLANLTVAPPVVFGGGIGATPATPVFAGLAPQAAGLYQVNVIIPEDAPRGVFPVTLSFPDSVSNAVLIAVE